MSNKKYVPQYKQKNINPVNVNFDKVPNIGKIQSDWYDGNSEEDLDPNQPMIDNNEYHTNEALNISTLNSLNNVLEDDYLLLVDGDIIDHNSLDIIESQVSDLIFGEHKLFPNKKLTLENILVFKRVKIKVGVFLK